MAEPRFFIDHRMVHDRKTGRHLVGMDSAGETPEALLAVLRELEIDRDAWRYTAKAFKVAHEYENELLQALRGLHATMAAHTHTPEEVLALDTAETLIAKAADIEPNTEVKPSHEVASA